MRSPQISPIFAFDSFPLPLYNSINSLTAFPYRAVPFTPRR
jgi:hypothetical protein